MSNNPAAEKFQREAQGYGGLMNVAPAYWRDAKTVGNPPTALRPAIRKRMAAIKAESK